jgi:hypothetical protein
MSEVQSQSLAGMKDRAARWLSILAVGGMAQALQ